MVSVLGIAVMIPGRYLVFEYLSLYGTPMHSEPTTSHTPDYLGPSLGLLSLVSSHIGLYHYMALDSCISQTYP